MIDTMRKYGSHVMDTYNMAPSPGMSKIPLVITLVSIRKPTSDLKKGEIKIVAGQYVLACPKCGLIAYLDHNVAIELDRISISPSVECPNPNCGFHEVITGWELRKGYKA